MAPIAQAMRSTLFVFALLTAPLAAAAECYRVDPAAGQVRFEAKQTGAPFRGAFRRFGGEVCLEQGRVARIDVWLEPASADTGLPEIDAALKDKEFFDTRGHPRVTFVGAGEAQGRARGTLQIKGTRREVTVPLRIDAAGGRTTAGGGFTLNRLDYAIGTGEWADTRWLGAEVRIEFSATLAPQ